MFDSQGNGDRLCIEHSKPYENLCNVSRLIKRYKMIGAISSDQDTKYELQFTQIHYFKIVMTWQNG